MTPRELGGAITRAEDVFVWVGYTRDKGVFIRVPKPAAREIVDEAKAEEVTNVEAHASGNEVFIGHSPPY